MIKETASAVQEEPTASQRAEMQLVVREIQTLLEDKNLLIPKSSLDIGEKVGGGLAFLNYLSIHIIQHFILRKLVCSIVIWLVYMFNLLHAFRCIFVKNKFFNFL